MLYLLWAACSLLLTGCESTLHSTPPAVQSGASLDAPGSSDPPGLWLRWTDARRDIFPGFLIPMAVRGILSGDMEIHHGLTGPNTVASLLFLDGRPQSTSDPTVHVAPTATIHQAGRQLVRVSGRMPGGDFRVPVTLGYLSQGVYRAIIILAVNAEMPAARAANGMPVATEGIVSVPLLLCVGWRETACG